MTTREERPATAAPLGHEDVVRYFEVAGPDYAAWSPLFNMHCGYFEAGMNPFRREAMLERMNEETLARLALPKDTPVAVADMGCGLGATARSLARRNARARVTGFTIVPWQVENGNRLSSEEGLAARVTLVLSDYTATPLAPASVDGAYAVESACYATGPDKGDLLAEMARVVRRGGRVVVSDVFRRDSRRMKPLLRRVYEGACRAWALREMADIGVFAKELEARGFCDVRVEDASWRVASSFAHVPFLCVKFAIQRVLRGDLVWSRERWQNLAGPLLGWLLGLQRSRFGYFLVSATRA